MEPTTLKALIDKAPDVNQIYKDFAQPAAKKLGIALETTIDFCNSGLLPIRLLNAKSQQIFTRYMKRLAAELETIEESKLIAVQPEIGVPILEKLTYTTTEEIANQYIKLISKASSTDTLHMVHPGYIKVIESITYDETLIIKYLLEVEVIPVIQHRVHGKTENSFHYITSHVCIFNVTRDLGILFPDNTARYLDNLFGLGIIELSYKKTLSNEEGYSELDTKYRDQNYEHFKSKFNSEAHSKIDYEKGSASITNFGHAFIKTCILAANIPD